jgi:hypothetical protein
MQNKCCSPARYIGDRKSVSVLVEAAHEQVLSRKSRVYSEQTERAAHIYFSLLPPTDSTAPSTEKQNEPVLSFAKSET